MTNLIASITFYMDELWEHFDWFKKGSYGYAKQVVDFFIDSPPEHDPSADICIAFFTAIFVATTVGWFAFTYHSAFLVAKNCKVVFNWAGEPKKVGDVVGFGLFYYQLDGTIHEEETLTQLTMRTSITITTQSGSVTVPHKLIKYIDNENCLLMVSFHVDVAGVYEINLVYEGFTIPGSPFKRTFLPGVPDPTKSQIVKPQKNVVIVTELVSTMLPITLNDKTGTPCLTDDIELDKFKLFASMNEEKYTHKDEDIIQNFNYSFINDCAGEYKTALCLTSKHAGVYNARVVYDSCLLSNGFFSIISVTPDEERLINKALHQEDGQYPCYPSVNGKLTAMGKEMHAVPMEVSVEVSPTSLTIHQNFWNVLTSRLVAFPLASKTKLRVIALSDETDIYTLQASDGDDRNAFLELGASQTRVLLTLFAHFMNLKTGRMICFEDKQKFFYDTISKSLPANRFCYYVVQVSRNKLIKSSYEATKYFTPADWKKSFSVSFLQEMVKDEDALKEWLIVLCEAFFKDERGDSMFVSLGDSQLVHPNSCRYRSKLYPVEYYELAGKIIGKCILEASVNEEYRGILLSQFTRSFLSQLLGISPTYKHYEYDNPEYYLGTISSLLNNKLTDTHWTFTQPEFDKNGTFIKHLEIVPNGLFRQVNDENKTEYLNAIAIYQLRTCVLEEINAFMDGLHSLIPSDLLAIFEINELEILMCGHTKFDLTDLQKYHVTGGSTTEFKSVSRLISWFWDTVKRMSSEEKSLLLQFTTGSCVLPRNGFKMLTPRFKICISASMNQIPTANKRLHQITISDHFTFEEFEESLLVAIRQDSRKH